MIHSNITGTIHLSIQIDYLNKSCKWIYIFFHSHLDESSKKITNNSCFDLIIPFYFTIIFLLIILKIIILKYGFDEKYSFLVFAKNTYSRFWQDIFFSDFNEKMCFVVLGKMHFYIFGGKIRYTFLTVKCIFGLAGKYTFCGFCGQYGFLYLRDNVF